MNRYKICISIEVKAPSETLALSRVGQMVKEVNRKDPKNKAKIVKCEKDKK